MVKIGALSEGAVHDLPLLDNACIYHACIPINGVHSYLHDCANPDQATAFYNFEEAIDSDEELDFLSVPNNISDGL